MHYDYDYTMTMTKNKIQNRSLSLLNSVHNYFCHKRETMTLRVPFQMYTISSFIFTLPPINSWKEGKRVGAEKEEVKEGGMCGGRARTRA